jgi:glutaminyl-tRNA synthetase
LFSQEDPDEGDDFKRFLNATSLEVVRGAKLEPSLADAQAQQHFQFERVGYFYADTESAPGKLVWNRTIELRDSWARIEQRGG